MPNPKSETVTKDVFTAVKNSKAGQIRYKSDKQGIIHSRIGQVGYTDKQLEENLVTFLADVKKAKPPSAKGVYISKVSISSTMGKGLELDMSALSFWGWYIDRFKKIFGLLRFYCNCRRP